MSNKTTNEDRLEELRDIYRKTSRYSHYQTVPPFLINEVNPEMLNKQWDRYDRERMDYFKLNIDFQEKSVLDIGGNIGYFSFESIEAGAKSVVCYEGDIAHADFVKIASDLFDKNVDVISDYFNFKSPIKGEPYDVVLLLNVLHHVGHDFGDKEISIENAKEHIVCNLNWFADKTEFLVYQQGFSWMADHSKPLFPNGVKGEMIDFIENAIDGHWKIVDIGIAQIVGEETTYVPLSDQNVARDDSLGEFRNRPIFILKSLK